MLLILVHGLWCRQQQQRDKLEDAAKRPLWDSEEVFIDGKGDLETQSYSIPSSTQLCHYSYSSPSKRQGCDMCLPGCIINSNEVTFKHKIGAGGYGEVYLAEWR